MTLRLRVTARAAAEIERVDEWWWKNRFSAAGAVREDLKSAFQLLLQPGIGQRAGNARLAGTRRLHMDRIRYYLYYRTTSEEVVVLSLWHSNRGRGPRV